MTVKLTPRTADAMAARYSHPDALEVDSIWDVPGFGKHQRPREQDAETTTIASLHLSPKQMFLYLFDFGDDWWHVITVEETDAAPDPTVSYPAVIAQRGESPAQYEEYDESYDEG